MAVLLTESEKVGHKLNEKYQLERNKRNKTQKSIIRYKNG